MITLYELTQNNNATIEDYKKLIAKLPSKIKNFDCDSELIGTIWTIDEIKYRCDAGISDKEARKILKLCEPVLTKESQEYHDAIDSIVEDYFRNKR